MGAEKKPRLNTKIKDVNREWISLKTLIVKPEILQPRAILNAEIVKKYAERFVGGSPFPVISVTELPDGSRWLDDGFNRHAAALRLGLTEMEAVVHKRTIEEALLAAIEVNFDEAHDGCHITDNDRARAAELMIRNETFRQWSDREIGRRCGPKGRALREIRLRLRDNCGIPLPEKVMTFKDGVWTGKWTKYIIRSRSNGMNPAISICNSPSSKNGTQASFLFNRKRIYVPSNNRNPEEYRDQFIATQENRRYCLTGASRLNPWLAHRSIHGKTVFSGVQIGSTFLLPIVGDSLEAIERAVGQIVLAHAAGIVANRFAIVGYFGSDSNATRAIDLAVKAILPIETMTLEEVVAEFGPKGGDAPVEAIDPEPNAPAPAMAEGEEED